MLAEIPRLPVGRAMLGATGLRLCPSFGFVKPVRAGYPAGGAQSAVRPD